MDNAELLPSENEARPLALPVAVAPAEPEPCPPEQQLPSLSDPVDYHRRVSRKPPPPPPPEVISVGVFVRDHDGRRAMVETAGDAPGSWDICFDDDDSEEYSVPAVRLTLDEQQPGRVNVFTRALLIVESVKSTFSTQEQLTRSTPDETMAAVAYLVQKNKGHLSIPDEVWRDTESGGVVYLGDMRTSSNRALLAKHAITHVVNCTADLPNHFEAGDADGDALTYLRFARIDVFRDMAATVDDDDRVHLAAAAATGTATIAVERANAADELGILGFFEPLFEFVDTATAGGGSVLIHCVAGAHRAGTSACAYVMHRQRALSAEQAIAYCKARRAVVDPAISALLVDKLRQLHAAHSGVALPRRAAAERVAAPVLDLDAEGRKVLEGIDRGAL